ncbi:MAG TPA: hypothetical protein VF510_15405, partial [Ktedonobacterales bacterium]
YQRLTGKSGTQGFSDFVSLLNTLAQGGQLNLPANGNPFPIGAATPPSNDPGGTGNTGNTGSTGTSGDAGSASSKGGSGGLGGAAGIGVALVVLVVLAVAVAKAIGLF